MQYQTGSIKELNSLLRAELSACDSYGEVLKSIGEMHFREVLADCQQSHERRARLLTQRIAELGGEPVQETGIWGTVARLITKGATKVGYEATVAALKEGENLEMKEYRHCIDTVDTANARFVAGMLPDQELTQNRMHMLHRAIG